MANKTIQITQVRSAIGRPLRQKRTLVALGLGRLHRTRTVTLTPAVAGMVAAVQHLLVIQEEGTTS